MSEENSFLFAEYAHPVLSKGKIKRNRLFLLLLYVIVGIAYVSFFAAVKIPQVIAILPLLLWILVHYTWRLVSFEYFVRVESGTVSFGKLRGKKQSVSFTCQAKELICVKKKSLLSKDALREATLLDFRYDPAADCYAALLTREERSVVILFAATDAVLTAMRYYNKGVEK